jgi:AraC-like DNA-binding protein
MHIELPVLSGWWNSIRPVLYGEEQCVPGHSFGPAVRHYFLLHYIVDGEGTFCRDGQSYRLSKGDLFIIHPDEVTVYTADQENPWHYIWLAFHAQSTPPFLQPWVIRQAPVDKYFHQLGMLTDPEAEIGKIYSITYEILGQLSRHAVHGSQPRRNTEYAAYAKALLDASFMRPIQIQQIAETLHIDRRYLTSLFQTTYGVTPKNYLLSLRLKQAKDFLEQGYAVGQSAEMAGFSDFSNFSKQFKQAYGTSPTKQNK